MAASRATRGLVRRFNNESGGEVGASASLWQWHVGGSVMQLAAQFAHAIAISQARRADPPAEMSVDH